MSFLIERQGDPKFPMFLVQETDGELVWDARKSEATTWPADEAEAIAAELNMHASIAAVVIGVRNTVESEPCQ